MKSKGTGTWTAIVASAAIASGVALPVEGLLDRWPMFAALVALAAVSGGRAVHVPGLRVQVTVSDLYVFCSLFVLPAVAAPIVALAGTASAVFGPGRRPLSIRTMFNLAAIPLSASAAAGVLSAVRAASPSEGWIVGGAFVAAAAYHLVNLALVSVAIRIESGRTFLGTVRGVGAWSAVACLVSLIAGAGLAFAAEGIGIAGLLPGISVAAPLAAFVEKAGAAARSIV